MFKIKALAGLVSGEGQVSAFKIVVCCSIFQKGGLLCPHVADDQKE